MKQKIVVTNLRIPVHYWQEVKVRASENGVSVNEFINQTLTASLVEQTLGKTKKDRRKRVKKNIFEALAELSKLPCKPMGELSEEDQIIYGLKQK